MPPTGESSSVKILLHPPSKVESDRRAYIRQWLLSLGIPETAVRSEYHTVSNGNADLYLTNRRVIIETKKGGKLKDGPHDPKTGSQPGESAFEQLDKYVRDERQRGQRYIDEDVDDHERPWIGAVTDAQVWWIWYWNPKHDRNVHDMAQKNPRWQGRVLDGSNIADLGKILNREPVGREWATSDMSAEFEDAKNDLMKLYGQKRTLRATATQKGLWLEQLRASGNAPESDVDEIFVLHTMLILIARMISAGKEYDESTITEGFVQWADLSKVPSLYGTVNQYDWRQEGGDILRALYEYFIPKQHRIIFGEYYTPDWLAELICKKVIDDEFIRKQIGEYNSGREPLRVLDPSCGSGTFLYHAARRIMLSEPMQDSGMGEAEMISLTGSMVCGIDIHPVAVEMAGANMRRLFPGISDSSMMIYQGDSLLTPRAMDSFYATHMDGTVPLRSPGGQMLLMPDWLAKSSADVSKFVNTAKDDKALPPNLGGGLEGYDKAQLARAHDQMRKIIREEDNGVWKWFILNQAGPANLRHKVGRIVSNPPWVQLNKMRVRKRQDEIKQMSKTYNLWVGGNTASNFDEAALFVNRCADLYVSKAEKQVSGWVIPHGSIDGNAWGGFRKKLGGEITGIWNLGRLPFPNTPTCATFFGVRASTKILKKKTGSKLNHDDSWGIAKTKTVWKDQSNFPDMMSEWVDEKGKHVARQGASIRPSCLVLVDDMKKLGKNVQIITRKSMHHPWSEIGTLDGTVPEEWIKNYHVADDLVPHLLYKTTQCVIPLKNEEWDDKRKNNRFWRDATDYYNNNHGQGSNTPKILEDRLNYNNGLFKQFERKGEYIVYNSSGDILYASRLGNIKHIIGDYLYSVRCSTKNEAFFLCAVMNAYSMLDAFKWSRKSDRDFHTHLWRRIPIPRYNHQHPIHKKLAALGKRAEGMAQRECEANSSLSTQKLRNHIRARLRESGIGGEVDECCRLILPEHAL